MTMVKKFRRVAIFDVDGTVFRSSLFIELVEGLVEKKIFPKYARTIYAEPLSHWRDRNGSYDDYIEAVVLSFMRYIKGVHYGKLMDVARKITALHQNRVYRYTRDLLKELKKRDYYLLAISQSPKAILDPFCKELGFNKIYGRIYELGPGDRFTGTILELDKIANKANIVRRAVEKENLTLSGSIAVGDTDGDIPMLELVERPICFNPNEKLYRHAKRMGWEVVVERKDVIYKL